MTHVCAFSTQEAEAGGFPGLWDQSRQHSEFKASLNCIARSCVKNYIYAIIALKSISVMDTQNSQLICEYFYYSITLYVLKWGVTLYVFLNMCYFVS